MEASERLAEAEATASEHLRRAQRDTKGFRSEIYFPGAEFALCLAEAQIMAAVVGVLNESVTDALRGFYKLRKAFLALDGILDAENKYMARKNLKLSIPNAKPERKQTNGGSVPFQRKQAQYIDPFADNDDEPDEFYDVDNTDEVPIPTNGYIGHIDKDTISRDMSGLSVNSEPPLDITNPPANFSGAIPGRSGSSAFVDKALAEGPDPSMFTNNIDAFIHSGASLHFGILQLLISIIPPTFSKLLFIIGFKGDRERGIKLLWQATRFHNINGAIAGLVILGYYNGLVSVMDILPNDGAAAYPKERCQQLLKDMRQRHPNSRLWLLQEAQMLSANRQIDKAVAILQDGSGSTLKQVEALQSFENSLSCMYLHAYQECAESFLKCIKLNNWSHGLYYYIAGCAHVELYRLHRYGCPFPSAHNSQPTLQPDPSKAEHHATTAEVLLGKVPQHLGKKKFMARQLPFDIFVHRKLNKWAARAKEWDVRLVDAVGVSPIEEMTFFWGGYARMRREHMEYSLARLAWSDGGVESGEIGTTNPHWNKEGLDEHAILAILCATIYRQLGETERSKALLKHEIIDTHKPEEFKGGFRDNWTAPIARYEMAVNLWKESDRSGVGHDRERLEQCSFWLEKVAAWEGYDLDARFGVS